MIPRNIYDRYHAHVYFNVQTVGQAEQLCKVAGEKFAVIVGRIHRKPVGPHPCWSCQLAFDAAEFERLIPWLDAERGELNVLVHGLTGNDLADHTDHASWLGEAQELKLSIFQQNETA